MSTTTNHTQRPAPPTEQEIRMMAEIAKPGPSFTFLGIRRFSDGVNHLVYRHYRGGRLHMRPDTIMRRVEQRTN